MTRDKLTISFWIYNYYYGCLPGEAYCDLEKCMAEMADRGFNTIRIDSGAGLCFDAQGNPRGELILHPPFPGYTKTRQQNFLQTPRKVDVLAKVIEVMTLAKRYHVKVILSSWFYLHTYWITDDALKREFFSIPYERRLMRFAVENDRLLNLLRERGLTDAIAFVELMNEVNDLPIGLSALSSPQEIINRKHAARRWHEEALNYLRERHPDIPLAADTSRAELPRPEILPGNIDVWNHHCYYLWNIYKTEFEQTHKEVYDFERFAHQHPTIGRMLLPDSKGIDALYHDCGSDRDRPWGWYLRVWLYNNLTPEAVAELDQRFTIALKRDYDVYRQRLDDAIACAADIHQWLCPHAAKVLGEGTTYCPTTDMRWEERSDEYWQLIAHEAELLRDNGYLGWLPRTNNGPEDPSWNECADRFLHVNRIFLEDKRVTTP